MAVCEGVAFPATFPAYFFDEYPLENSTGKIKTFLGEYSGDSSRFGEEDEGDDSCESSNLNERAEFWQTKHVLLEEILSRSSPSESRLRRDVIEAVDNSRETRSCACRKPNTKSCVCCLRRAITDQLLVTGYNAAICKSKWKSTKEIPAGEHEYLDVIVPSKDHKKETRFLIELEFRGEFVMAKSGDEYRKLVNRLPEIYVGKPEQLRAILRIVCDAGKQSMKEKKMHMGPWRKRKFMQMKWLSSHRTSFSGEFLAGSSRQEGADISILDFGLLDRAPCLRFSAAHPVEVA